MILILTVSIWINKSILHVCGDDPLSIVHNTSDVKVFSTYVEMIPWNGHQFLDTISILHVCGDDPDPDWVNFLTGGYSPRMWR